MKSKDYKQLEDELAQKHACYVLITCDKPESDGKMNVKLSYSGDAALASYLIEGAQSIIDEHYDDALPF